MITIVLPGLANSNQDWLDGFKSQFKSKDKLYLYRWQTWDQDCKFNEKLEVARLKTVLNSYTEVNFIAKSIGTKVLTRLIPKINTNISKIILCGIAIDPFHYFKLLRSYRKDNLLIIQNSGDPCMPYKGIEIYLKLINCQATLLEKQSDTHDYPYYDLFEEWLGDGR